MCNSTIKNAIATTNEATVASGDNKMAAPPPLPKQKEFNEAIWKQLLHVDEIFAAVQLLTANPLQSNLKGETDPDLLYCDYILGSVARPYAAAIRQLPRSTLINVTILHHALRALDTIEDDMTTFVQNPEQKIEYLQNFVKLALGDDPHWSLQGVGLGDEALLLQEWPKCHRVFQTRLCVEAQTIVRDITHRMALGMCEFIQQAEFRGPSDIDQYNSYCHYVAGLVAEGLVRLFCLDGLEHPSLAKELKLADLVGFFLQKCNIIRDFLEDYHEQRVFWPHSVVNQYVPSMEYLADPRAPIEPKLECLNHLVTDALQEVPHVLEFLSKLESQETHRFFALLLLGAMATLTRCYNNPNVFSGKVRIRKGLACQLALAASDRDAVQRFFGAFATQILQHNNKADPKTSAACQEIQKATQSAREQKRSWVTPVMAFWIAAILVVAWLASSLLHLLSLESDQRDPLDHYSHAALNGTLVAATLGLGFYVSWPPASA